MIGRRASARIEWPADTEYGVLDLDALRAAPPVPLPPLLSSGAELLAELEDALEKERRAFAAGEFGVAA